VNAPGASGTVEAPTARLVSLDALRGFDMAWIVGGREVVVAAAAATGWPWLDALAAQLEHPRWHGFTFWDLIFPLFLFIAGAAMPFALTARRERGVPRRALLAKVAQRAALLVLLGAVYNGLLTFDLETQRWASVLGRIGLAYAGAAVVVLTVGPRGQLLWAVGLALGYWAALELVPVPGYGAGDLSPGHTVTSWVDRALVPGRLHRGDHDPEGLFGTLPAVATALIGALAGHRLRRAGPSDARKVAELLGAGLLLTLLGLAWDRVLPLNKTLWTSSFVALTGGLSLLLLGTFHGLVDMLGRRRWALPFTVVGANAITAYMLHRFVDWQGLARAVLVTEPARVHPVLVVAAGPALLWLLLYALWRRRWLLRV